MTKPAIALALFVAGAAVAVSAQSPSTAFPRGSSFQSCQDPGLKGVLTKCKTPPRPFSIPGAQPVSTNQAPPPEPPPPPASTAIPGVIAAGQTWKAVWSWEG